MPEATFCGTFARGNNLPIPIEGAAKPNYKNVAPKNLPAVV